MVVMIVQKIRINVLTSVGVCTDHFEVWEMTCILIRIPRHSVCHRLTISSDPTLSHRLSLDLMIV